MGTSVSATSSFDADSLTPSKGEELASVASWDSGIVTLFLALPFFPFFDFVPKLCQSLSSTSFVAAASSSITFEPRVASSPMTAAPVVVPVIAAAAITPTTADSDMSLDSSSSLDFVSVLGRTASDFGVSSI